MIWRVVLGLLLAVPISVKDKKYIVFHVTGVEQTDDSSWCVPGACNATRITVTGYAIEDRITID